MSQYQQHRYQMIESHIRQYRPSGTGHYSEDNMMSNLRILADSHLDSSRPVPLKQNSKSS